MNQDTNYQPDLNTETLATAEDMKSHMVKGSAWMVTTRWVIRLLGLCSTIFLARILAPSDFGLFAIAMLVIGFSEVVGKAGQEMAIIRHPSPTRDHVDSAWTASIITSFVLGFAVIASAPFVAIFFNEPRAHTLILVLSIRVFLMGFENIGVVMFRRDLNFNKEFRYGVYEKLLQVTATLTLAVVLGNYWALIIGSIAGRIMLTGLSYIVHPYRPKLCTRKIGEIWGFSLWILFSRIGNFFSMRLDRFFVGTITDARAMGFYHIGTELGRMPTYELIDPTSRALLPTYVKLTHNLEELKKGFINTLSFITAITFSTGIGFSLIAEDFVLLVYGAKWAGAIPIVTWIAIAAAAQTFANTAIPVFIAMGRSRMVALLNWLHVACLASALFIMAPYADGVSIFAATRMTVVIAIAPIFLMILSTSIPLGLREVIGVVWRPIIATALMALVVANLPGNFPELRILRLFLDSACGAAIFIGALLALWEFSGRPEGVEKQLINALKRTVHYLKKDLPNQFNKMRLRWSITQTHPVSLNPTLRKLYRGLFLDQAGPVLIVTKGNQRTSFSSPLTIKKESPLLTEPISLYSGIALHRVTEDRTRFQNKKNWHALLQQTSHQLSPGGTLVIVEQNPYYLRNVYALLKQKLFGSLFPTLGIRRWQTALNALEFEKIECYAIFYNLDNPNNIVPLDPLTARTFYSSFAQGGLFSNRPLIRWARKFLNWVGLATCLNPALLIIARKPNKDAAL